MAALLGTAGAAPAGGSCGSAYPIGSAKVGIDYDYGRRPAGLARSSRQRVGRRPCDNTISSTTVGRRRRPTTTTIEPPSVHQHEAQIQALELRFERRRQQSRRRARDDDEALCAAPGRNGYTELTHREDFMKQEAYAEGAKQATPPLRCIQSRKYKDNLTQAYSQYEQLMAPPEVHAPRPVRHVSSDLLLVDPPKRYRGKRDRFPTSRRRRATTTRTRRPTRKRTASSVWVNAAPPWRRCGKDPKPKTAAPRNDALMYGPVIPTPANLAAARAQFAPG